VENQFIFPDTYDGDASNAKQKLPQGYLPINDKELEEDEEGLYEVCL